MDTRARLLLSIAAAAAVTAALACAPRAADAQEPVRGYAVDRFEPSDRGSDWFVNESLDLRGAPRPAFGAVLDWAYRPLVLFDPSNIQGNPRANAITDQVVTHIGGSMLLSDRLRLGVDLPIALFQDGEDLGAITTTTRSPEEAALGDVRASGDVRVLGAYGAAFSAAVGAQVHFPTGSRALFTSDGTMRVTPRVLLAGNAGGFVYAAVLAFAYRPLDATFEGRPLGSEAKGSVALGVKVNDLFVIGPEIAGSTVVTGGDRPFRTRNSPVELLLGGHVTLGDRWRMGTAIGPGLTRGDGAPTMRMIVSLELLPDVCVDRDGDGICADEDACPDVDGSTAYRGCPADRDHDGFADPDDACPDEPGIRTGDPQTTGCPIGVTPPATAPGATPAEEPPPPPR